eukprot:885213-Pelagomonas_calceolata.AAC.2
MAQSPDDVDFCDPRSTEFAIRLQWTHTPSDGGHVIHPPHVKWADSFRVYAHTLAVVYASTCGHSESSGMNTRSPSPSQRPTINTETLKDSFPEALPQERPEACENCALWALDDLTSRMCGNGHTWKFWLPGFAENTRV